MESQTQLSLPAIRVVTQAATSSAVGCLLPGVQTGHTLHTRVSPRQPQHQQILLVFDSGPLKCLTL